MKIKETKKDRKKIIITIIITIAFVGGVVYAYTASQNNKSDPQEAAQQYSDNNKPSSSTTDTVKKDSSSSSSSDIDKKSVNNNTDKPAPVKNDPESGKRVVQMTVSVDTAGATIYIRGGINNAVEQDGICFAQLTGPNGQTIRKETSLLPNAATTDCKTIQLSTSELSAGKWKITLNYASNTTKGQSSEHSLQIN